MASVSFSLRPLCVSTLLSKYPLNIPSLCSPRTPPLLLSRSLFPSLTSHTPTRAFTPTLCLTQEQGNLDASEASGVQETDVGEASESDGGHEEEEEESVGMSGGGGVEEEEVVQAPKLSVKEKKELASYAHSLGKKLKSQLVGKSGVTHSVASSFIENLESNELLKIKIHGTCPGELEDVVKQLEEATGSVVVSQIGRTIIVYRPSITKMKAEEKKRQACRVYVRKESKAKPLLLTKVQVLQPSGRGCRGSSRV